MQIPLFLRNDLARPKPQSTPPSPTTLRPDGSDSETERAKNIVRMDVTLGEPAQLFTVAHLTWAAAPPAARPPISLVVFIFPLLLLLLLEIVLGGSTGHGPHVLPLHYRLSELRAESRMPNAEPRRNCLWMENVLPPPGRQYETSPGLDYQIFGVFSEGRGEHRKVMKQIDSELLGCLDGKLDLATGAANTL